MISEGNQHIATNKVLDILDLQLSHVMCLGQSVCVVIGLNVWPPHVDGMFLHLPRIWKCSTSFSPWCCVECRTQLESCMERRAEKLHVRIVGMEAALVCSCPGLRGFKLTPNVCCMGFNVWRVEGEEGSAHCRRKFRSHTSDNMDRWQSRGGKSQRREQKRRRKKMQVREKVSKRCVFSNVLWLRGS